jgi:dihydrolipoamide dehydrogenase
VIEEGLRSALRDAAAKSSRKRGSDLAACGAFQADALD